MEINPSSRYSPVPPVATRPTRRANPVATDAGEFAGTEALQRALNATPDVRPEAVAQGKALVASPNYPPDAILRGLAELFVVGFGAAKPPSGNPPVDS